MAQYVYLIQDAKYISMGKSVCKIGKTTLPPDQRIAQYTKNSLVFSISIVGNCETAENIIKKIFAQKFKLIEGREWFEGDITEMKIAFLEIIMENYKNELQEKKLSSVEAVINSQVKNLSINEEQVRSNKIIAFTKEYIKEKINLLTSDHLKDGLDGIVRFIVSIATVGTNLIYKCTDSSKMTFSRVDEDGTWKEDKSGHMLNYIFENMPLDKVYDCKFQISEIERKCQRDYERLILEKKMKELTKIILAQKIGPERKRCIRDILDILRFKLE